MTGEYGVCDDYGGNEGREGKRRVGRKGTKKNLELYLAIGMIYQGMEADSSLIPRPHTKNWGLGMSQWGLGTNLDSSCSTVQSPKLIQEPFLIAENERFSL